MKNTIDQIYQYIESNNTATIAQLSQKLGLTKADIRHHMRTLLAEGRVKKTETKSLSGAGRPPSQYTVIPPLNRTLVERLFAGYSTILRKSGISDSEVDRFLPVELLRAFHPQGSPSARLNQAVIYLSEMGIQARWEAGAEGPNLILVDSPLVSAGLRDALRKEILSTIES